MEKTPVEVTPHGGIGTSSAPQRVSRRILQASGPSISFEFFPPKDEAGEEVLWRTIAELEPYRPAFVSVTYGAGGSTRDTTVSMATRIARDTSLVPLVHLTCVGQTVEEVHGVLASLTSAGVHNVLALRGDPPAGPGTPWEPVPGGLSRACDLVGEAVTIGDFCVGVAAFTQGHRESPSMDHDIEVLLAKQAAGAEFAITDMFFRAKDYFTLVEHARAAGVDFPIVPGLMPIRSLDQVARMAKLSGHEVPGEVVERIAPYAGDAEGMRAVGLDVATELAAELLTGGAPGLHFFTLNRAGATREILGRLGIAPK